MNSGMRWKKYKKDDLYSYSFGPFPSLELLEKRPEDLVEMLISPDFHDKDCLVQKLETRQIPYSIGDRQIERLAPKGNTYVVGVFKKYAAPPLPVSHLVLDQVRDMGNLGNICRTMLALGLKDLILLGNCCDIFDPRTIRASMGAIFSIRFAHYENVKTYLDAYGQGRNCYAFMLSPSAITLPHMAFNTPYSLIFGNEGAGLDPEVYAGLATGVMIPQSKEVDSLNLTTACAIGLYQAQNF